jgi:hypothetical protein
LWVKDEFSMATAGPLGNHLSFGNRHRQDQHPRFSLRHGRRSGLYLYQACPPGWTVGRMTGRRVPLTANDINCVQEKCRPTFFRKRCAANECSRSYQHSLSTWGANVGTRLPALWMLLALLLAWATLGIAREFAWPPPSTPDASPVLDYSRHLLYCFEHQSSLGPCSPSSNC